MACSQCNNSNSGCSCCNPCDTCPAESAENETLPSALGNFVNAFFGTVTKTIVNGEVVWTLPCDLDVGLPSNPRGDAEGLSCYFLRLFRDGITGLIGPKGDTGENGGDGNNAYTVTTSAFVTPTLAAPSTQFTIIPSAAVATGLSIFLPGAGWFVITDVFQQTTVFATLIELIDSPETVINAGALVLPTGPRGLSIKGDPGNAGLKGDTGATGNTGTTGNVGPTGLTGPAGATATNANQQVRGTALATYTLTNSYGKVDFGSSDAEVVLSAAGTYLILAVVAFSSAPAAPDGILFKLYNATDGLDVDKSEVAFDIDSSISGRVQQVTLHAVYTISAAPKTIQIYGFNVTAARGTVYSDYTSILYVKLS